MTIIEVGKTVGALARHALAEPDSAADWPLPLAELAQLNLPEMKRNPTYHGALKSMVDTDWHYVQHEKLGPELYEWQTDAREERNLAATAEGQTIVSRFEQRLQAVLARGRSD